MKTAPLALAAVATLALPASALAADPVEGQWLTQGGSARVRVAPCANDKAKMCGTIVWLRAPNGPDGRPQTDVNNPDPALRDRPVVGLMLIRDFKPAGPGKWAGGKIYDPESGRTYASKIAVNGDGTLKVEGCIAVVCQAQTWRRAS
jgi:uncharacterized protein (DUF2147 family)